MRPVRLHRSELTVPGCDAGMIEKATKVGADSIMLDLEDAVPPAEKARAREEVIEALARDSWRARSLSVRINGLETEWCYRDIIDLVEAAGDRLDTITIPKVGSAAEVEFVATLLAQVECAAGVDSPVGLSVLIETAGGMANLNEIAAACPSRLEAMVFGVADYAASLQSISTSIGGFEGGYAVLSGDACAGRREYHYGDQWHHALAAIAVACRANGLRPIDGPYGDLGDLDGYRAAARRAAVLGFEGKWAIHPSQVALANQVFTPDSGTTDRTKRIVAAMREAAAEGRGAVTLDGALIDAASLRMADHLLRKIEQIEAPEGRPDRATIENTNTT